MVKVGPEPVGGAAVCVHAVVSHSPDQGCGRASLPSLHAAHG